MTALLIKLLNCFYDSDKSHNITFTKIQALKYWYQFQDIRSKPCASRSPARMLLAASDGWKPSQNTYCVALEHVPIDLALHSSEVSRTPVPQQAFLDSNSPVFTRNWKGLVSLLPIYVFSWYWIKCGLVNYVVLTSYFFAGTLPFALGLVIISKRGW